MGTKPYFSNIEATIQRELDAAQISITVAVAWLTASKLFDALVRAAKRGVLVRIALQDDNINRSSTLAMERLTAANGQCYWITNKKGHFHHKFCIIDNNIVINGSYNWTNNARLHNDENIMIIDGDLKMVAKYIQAFDNVLKKYGHTSTDTNTYLKPLKVVPKLSVIAPNKLLTIPPKIEELEFLHPERHQKTKQSSGRLTIGRWLFSIGVVIGIVWLSTESGIKNLIISTTKQPLVSTASIPVVKIKQQAVLINPSKPEREIVLKPARPRTQEKREIVLNSECNFKTVMSDDDYRACGINPPK